MQNQVLAESQSVSENLQSIEVQTEVKLPKKVRARIVTKLDPRLKFPSIPVRGLWDQATESERVLAKQIAMTMLESWVGIKTKSEAAKILGLRPVRFWQMSNQAMAGMMAGCLTQPRVRKKKGSEMGKQSEANQIIELQKQIKILLSKIEHQEVLIDVMKTMPGMNGVGVKDDIAPISSRLQTKNRRKVTKDAVVKRTSGGGATDGDGSDATKLEASITMG